VDGRLLQSTLRESQTFFRSPRLLGTFAVVVLVFAITGPFATAERMPFLARLAYWVLIHAAAWTVAILFSLLAERLLASVLKSVIARMMCGSLAAALPISLAIALVDYGFFAETPTLASVAGAIPNIAPLCVLFCILAYLTMSDSRRGMDARESGSMPTAPAALGAEAAPCRFPAPLIERLRPDNRGALLRLGVSDHYTEIFTARGRELLLMRFSDALNEVGDTPGLQVHRSHWVADSHVAGIEQRDGRLIVTTKTGERLPVSRTYLSEVRARYGRLEA
jgi:DNA-binding LytR/AlgR family response regulator